MSRRTHNEHQIKVFLNKSYPESAPGSPDPDQTMDDNKKGSRVIIKSEAYDRVDAALDAKERNPDFDPERNRSYDKLDHLFSTEVYKALGNAHGLATRFVLLNVNSSGGWVEMERLEALGGDAAAIARLCREAIDWALDRLEGERYWLNVGDDETFRSKVHERNVRNARSRVLDVHDSYRNIARDFRAYVAAHPDTSWAAAKAEFSKAHDISVRKIERSLAFCADERQGERPGESEDPDAAA